MKDETEILLRYSEEQWTHIRHLEEQRATFTNLVIITAAGIMGFVIQQGMKKEALPLVFLMVILGITGAFASAKFYERYQLHWKRKKFWRERIDVFNKNAGLIVLDKAATREHRKNRPILYELRVHTLWIILHLLIACLGIVIAAIFIVK